MRRVRKVKKPVQVVEELDLAPAKVTDAVATTDHATRRQMKMQKEAELLQQLQAEAAAMDQENARRPCPVPKPKGALGRLLGFEDSDDTSPIKAETR